MRIAPGIHRISRGQINVYLLEDAGEVTIVDAGLRRFWRFLPAELAAMGRTLADVRAIVLTHAHEDHTGFAEQARRDRGIGVRVHEDDAPLARGEVKRVGGFVHPWRFVPILRFTILGLWNGGPSSPRIREVITFGAGATLDVPGSPRVIALPGHSAGSAALHVASRDALFIGDAIVTYVATTGRDGASLSPLNADRELARASLGRLDGLEAGLVLPGHGEPWTGGVAAAVAEARARA